MRPTQAMDDSGITQVLGLLSEPSPHHGRKGVGVEGDGKREGRRKACQLCIGWHSQREPGAPQLRFPAPPVFLSASHL